NRVLLRECRCRRQNRACDPLLRRPSFLRSAREGCIHQALRSDATTTETPKCRSQRELLCLWAQAHIPPRSARQRVPSCHCTEPTPTECPSPDTLCREERTDFARRHFARVSSCPRHESNVRPPA